MKKAIKIILTLALLSGIIAISGCEQKQQQEGRGMATIENSKVSVEKAEQVEEDLEPGIIGGERDEYGCLGPAGYQWCPSQQKCMRMWEEYCEEYAEQYRGEIGIEDE